MNLHKEETLSPRASLDLLFHVSREIASALDLPIVLQKIIVLSMRYIGAVSGSIIVLDEEGEPIESAIIHKNAPVLEQTTDQLKITLDKGLAGWVARNHQAVLIQDTHKDDRWLKRPDDADDATGAKSVVSSPLLSRSELVGVITLVHPTPNFFSNEHLALIQAIADQAGIAVVNARLYEESQRKARVMSALAESASAITASLKSEDVLQHILEQISLALGVEVVSLALIDFDNDVLVFQASTSGKGENVVGRRLKLGSGIAGWVAENGKGTIVPDAYSDSRFYPHFDEKTGFKTHSIACAPIWSKGVVIGVLEALNPYHGFFSPDALSVLSGIGSLAGTAITHAHLFENLEAAHQRYRDLFDDSIDMILITDSNGLIQEANKQTITLSGFDAQAIALMRIDQIHRVDLEITGAKYDTLTMGKTITYESEMDTKFGDQIPIEVHSRKVEIEGRNFLQWIFRDITERKNLDQIREDLISMIYHDLRSPLANVVSTIDVLFSMIDLEQDPAIEPLFQIAERSTERIQRLTDSLLDISRLEAGQSVIETGKSDANVLIEEAIEIVLPLIENKKQKISTEFLEPLPPLDIDRDMIKRVIINILENATKYASSATTIQVHATKEKEFLKIWIQDIGPGIPKADQKRIFQKYNRLDHGSRSRGIGLGLAYCRLAIESHGGKIWIDSEYESGSRFVFTLPIYRLSI